MCKIGMEMKIALIADKRTAELFKLGGLQHIFDVNFLDDFEEILGKILLQTDFTILLITDKLIDMNRDLIHETVEEHEFPIIISICIPMSILYFSIRTF